jgi:hypothetical protein
MINTGCFFFNATIVNFVDNFYLYVILNVNKIKVINVLQLKTIEFTSGKESSLNHVGCAILPTNMNFAKKFALW